MISGATPGDRGPGGRATGRAISSPAAATKRHQHARQGSAPPVARSCCTCPTGHGAEHVQQAIIDKMQHLPKLLRNSLIPGPGSGTRLHKTDQRLAERGRLCRDPHSRGSAAQRERTNGLLPVSPKGTDCPSAGGLLGAVVEELNDRRKGRRVRQSQGGRSSELLGASRDNLNNRQRDHNGKRSTLPSVQPPLESAVALKEGAGSQQVTPRERWRRSSGP